MLGIKLIHAGKGELLSVGPVFGSSCTCGMFTGLVLVRSAQRIQFCRQIPDQNLTYMHFFPSAPPTLTGIVVFPCVRTSLGLRPFVLPEQRFHSNSLMTSAIILKFGGKVHSTMKQIAI